MSRKKLKVLRGSPFVVAFPSWEPTHLLGSAVMCETGVGPRENGGASKEQMLNVS